MAVHRSVTGAWKRTVFVLVVLVLLVAPTTVFARQYKTTSRISISSTGVQGINIQHPVINGDGRYVAFWSDKEGLVVGDTNFVGDVFVRDTQNNTTTRVSLGYGGVQTARTGGLPTSYPDIDISDSGCIVVYASDATNIRNVADTNETSDVFAVDRCGAGFPTIQVSVQDNTGSTGVQANQGGTNPRVSGNGQFVLFRSSSTDILFDSNGTTPDIYIYDRVSFRTSRVNVASDGTQPIWRTEAPATASRTTGSSLRSRRSPPTSSRAIPTAAAISSSATARTIRRSASWGLLAHSPTAAATTPA